MSTALAAFAAFVAHLLQGVGFWDTAIFQAAAPTLGLTHPTGYPTYLLLGWAFTTLVPIGDDATRMNLLSAVTAAAAVGGLYVLVRSLGAGRCAAVAAALAFAFAQPFWRTAVRADPHTLHVAFAIALLLLVLEWRRRGRPDRWLVGAGLVFGLAAGNHLLTLMLAPALAGFVLLSEPRVVRRPRSVAAPVGAALAGACVYAYVPIRAAANPPIHHDFAPVTWDTFWRYVLGGDFQGSMGFLSLAGPGQAVAQLGSFVQSLEAGLGSPVAVTLLLLGAVGAIALLRKDPPAAALLLLAGGVTLYAALTYVNADIERYYFVPVMVLAALAGLGAQLLLRAAIPAMPSLVEAAPLLLLVPAALAATNAGRIQNPSARCFADATFADVAPNAVVMSWWSYSTPLWYEQVVGRQRPDVTIFNGIDLVPAELDRRYGQGRPIYLIQPDSSLSVIRARYTTTPLDACGFTIQRVTGRVGSAR